MRQDVQRVGQLDLFTQIEFKAAVLGYASRSLHLFCSSGTADAGGGDPQR